MASRESWGKPGPPCSSRTLTGPEPIRLVHTLYLPPATRIMRMPATRMPPGFKASVAGDDLEADAVCAESKSGDVQVVTARAAEYSQNFLRFICHRIAFVLGVDYSSGSSANEK